MLIEPTAGFFRSLTERMDLKAGESLLILGPGARGLFLLQIAKTVGALPVIITEVIITDLMRNEKVRLKLAREFGADAAVKVEKEDLFEVVKKGG